MGPSNMLIGPFDINGVVFDMNIINETVYLNDAEKWRIQNNTSIAHPFHIHDIQFDIININGAAVPKWEKGKKDVVLVMPFQYVELVTKFEDFANDSVPYMYHCHLLHHEDDGMMGTFRVIDTSTTTGIFPLSVDQDLILFPNPVLDNLFVQLTNKISDGVINVLNVLGEIVMKKNIVNASYLTIDVAELTKGIYFIQVKSSKRILNQIFVKE